MTRRESKKVTSITELTGQLNTWSGPILTQYGTERVELTGPVISRWLSKIAFYLHEEVAADLFGTGETTPTRIYTTLEPWQDILWQIAARTTGWEYLDTRSPLPGDLLVTNHLGKESDAALESGAIVLAQPATYLAFRWTEDLSGALDALSEIAGQPDSLSLPTAPLLEPVCSQLLGQRSIPSSTSSNRVALLWEGQRTIGEVLDQWMNAHSVIVIDPRVVSPADLQDIARAEGLEEGLVRYA